MSSEPAIEVTNLGKCYELYQKPSDRLKQSLARGRRQYFKEFWALRNASFNIAKRETVGIIGRNGSGKSTLLQMICGTLNPTEGSVRVQGRVAALLELGAGFNPEFTGAENVYMAASLYGLSRSEVDARFDDIAAFADIGDHIHQPVKTYSSGMYVRLAFAVIAHVDADVLVVDEALAVGDAVFTQKCMRFIREFQRTGTLLFVSHDLGAVQNLCESAIWLDGGQVRLQGPSKKVAEAYLQQTLQDVYGSSVELKATGGLVEASSAITPDERARDAPVDYAAQVTISDNLTAATGWKSGGAEVLGVHLEDMAGNTPTLLEGGERVRIRIRAIAHQDLNSAILGFLVKDRLGQDLFGENTLPLTALRPCVVPAGQEFEAQFVFVLPMLPNGSYVVMASVADGDLHNNTQHHYLHDALVLHVSSSKVRWGLVGLSFDRIALEVIK